MNLDPIPSADLIGTDPDTSGRLVPSKRLSSEFYEWLFNCWNRWNLIPDRSAPLSKTALQASLGATAIPTKTNGAGVFRVSYQTHLTQAGSVSSSLQVLFSWTLNGSPCSHTFPASATNDITLPDSGTWFLRTDAGSSLTVTVTYASAGATVAIYNLDVIAEELA